MSLGTVPCCKLSQYIQMFSYCGNMQSFVGKWLRMNQCRRIECVALCPLKLSFIDRSAFYNTVNKVHTEYRFHVLFMLFHFTTTITHNRFTALFPGPSGWAGARRELLDFMVQWEINTDHPAGCPPPPSPIFVIHLTILIKLNYVKSYQRQSINNSLAVTLKILRLEQKTHCLTAHHTHNPSASPLNNYNTNKIWILSH